MYSVSVCKPVCLEFSFKYHGIVGSHGSGSITSLGPLVNEFCCSCNPQLPRPSSYLLNNAWLKKIFRYHRRTEHLNEQTVKLTCAQIPPEPLTFLVKDTFLLSIGH
uniref:Uncharacterized protein n=1 Tax=Pyxicephalus adspersus TaxID=30357 RepID=A0AAV3A4Y3_PYXAD|nr:TPA: hypothetical protein GDO54_017566 [Pyxicephalus adspersus]